MIEKIKILLENLDISINKLLTKIHKQNQIINTLTSENEHLKRVGEKIRDQIEEYVVQLEKIKHEHLNNNSK